MRKGLRGLRLILGGLTLILFSAYSTLAAGPIKVGIILPLTGEKAVFGEIEKNSFLMALSEINRAGGVRGSKIELLFEDDTGKPEVARAAAEKLISKDKVVMLAGEYGSSETFSVAGVAQQQKIPFLINSGAADKITEQGWNYVFRLNPTASEYPQAAESFFKEVAKPKTAVILFENTLFGTSSAQESEKSFRDSGIQILFKEGYEHGAVDFKPLLVKVKNANPDLVYMISYLMDASLLIRQSKELDFNPKLFVGGGGGFVLAEFYDNVGKLAEGVFAATLWDPNLPYPKAMDYYKNYKKIYGKVTDFRGAAAYASMYVAADALKRAKALTPEDVRQAMAATNMMTIFGRVKFISYGKKTNQNRLPTYLAQWLNGKMECVWPKEFATAKYHFPHRPWNER